MYQMLFQSLDRYEVLLKNSSFNETECENNAIGKYNDKFIATLVIYWYNKFSCKQNRRKNVSKKTQRYH